MIRAFSIAGQDKEAASLIRCSQKVRKIAASVNQLSSG